MKSKMFKKLMAASLATVMTVGLAGCGGEVTTTPESTEPSSSEPVASEPVASEPVESETETEEVGAYTVLTDENGNVYDLGGMEIVIRNWFYQYQEPKNEYEEARAEYREWIQDTYNFTIKEELISDWGMAPQDFVDYVTTGGDDVNYVFTLRDDPAVTNGMKQGLFYDLSTLDCLDFTEEKFALNKVHEMYVSGDQICCMATGVSEPRGGMYFNKRLLTEAGVDPETIYDMQADGTWTWDAWTGIMEKVQRDVNNDGVIDVYGFDANYGIPVSNAVYSNDSEYVGLVDGKYTYKFEDAATVEALEWIVDCFKKYALVRPEDAQWDYYKQAFINGQCAFMPDESYCATVGQFLQDMTDEIGFVAFPKGPQATDYTNVWTNNMYAIPGCYDADRAWKIAFAYNLFTEDVPGYEGYVDVSNFRNGMFDTRAVEETIPMMMEKGKITYHTLIPNLDMGAPFLYNFGSWTVVSEVLDGVRESYKAYIDEANK